MTFHDDAINGVKKNMNESKHQECREDHIILVLVVGAAN